MSLLFFFIFEPKTEIKKFCILLLLYIHYLYILLQIYINYSHKIYLIQIKYSPTPTNPVLPNY